MEIFNSRGQFISPLSDYGFKVTFGNEADTTFLKKALQALIASPVPIKTIEFVKTEIYAITNESRSGIYDVACVDENSSHFIVEMQLGDYPEFIQRMKFYALHRLNTEIRKDEYKFENLPKIYCIGILAKNIFSQIADYYNVAILRNSANETIDEQLTFITVELAKFTKQLVEIETDLDKLIYTMKNLHTVTPLSEYPEFWTEEWLKKAIQELDLRVMTPEERLQHEMVISANAIAMNHEKKKIEAAKAEGRAEAWDKAWAESKIETLTENVKAMLSSGELSIEKIAQFSRTSIEFVTKIQQNLSAQK